MNNFLSDYIFSTASKTTEKIQDILAAAQTSKENLDTIAQRLTDIETRAPIVVKPEPYGGLITNVGLDGLQRDTDIRLKELFDDSNLISLLLDTHTEILSTEIASQSQQLSSFEKYIDNYSFLLSDAGFYDYAHSESFNDEIRRELSDTLSAMLHDRSRKEFDRETELLTVDRATGSLVMGSRFETSYDLNPSISLSNASAYITSDTGLEKMVNLNVGEGWRVAISSPRPINSALYDGLEKGVQFEIQLLLNEPSLSDSFSVHPMSELPIRLLSVKIYDEGNTSFQELITETFILDQNRTFFFQRQNVGRVVLIVSQPIYTRGKLDPVLSESRYKDAAAKVQRPLMGVNFKETNKLTQKAYRRIFSKWSPKSEKNKTSLVKPSSQLSKYSPEKMNLKEHLSYEKDQYLLFSRFKVGSKRQSIFVKWIIQKLFKDQPDLLDRFTEDSIGTHNPSTDIVRILENKDSAIKSSNFLNYEYSLGIRSVSLGVSSRSDRGLYISKPVPAPVQAGAARIRVEEENYYLLRSYLDNKYVTSIEYSVTNRSNPKSENDWVPIIPSNKKDEIVNERIFVQSSGYGAFRFRCRELESLSVYKNGYLLDKESLTFVRSDDTFSTIGVFIPSADFSLNGDDIYTADYLPVGDPTTVVFADSGFAERDFAAAYDDNGAGELFNGSGPSNAVDLKNYPYVDFHSLEESSYSSEYGLTSSYQPVSVLLSDGTIAYNYTNYNGFVQNDLVVDDPNLAFVHSGNKIIFNKKVTGSFRVYYQYQPSYLRYRIIFRINMLDSTSPKVDSLTIKAKMGSSVLGLNNKRV